MNTQSNPNCLPKPRTVLRIGFAGTRNLPKDTKKLEKALSLIFSTIGNQLIKLSQKPRQPEGQETSVHEFYSTEAPLLRLVTGLAKGADDMAATALENTTPGFEGCIETTLAGVIPFKLPIYRESRDKSYQDRFDDLASQCEYISTLDGIYEDSQKKIPVMRRKKAYSAQSQVLLRHCDILIAATKVDPESKAGGTVETINRALNLGRPVIFIDTETGGIHHITPGKNYWTILNSPALANDPLTVTLETLVEKVLEDPASSSKNTKKLEKDSLKFLKIYFQQPELPKSKKGKQVPTFPERCWNRFNGLFKYGAKAGSDKPLDEFNLYRSRSSKLNYYFSGLYRGTFLINYILAMVAVGLAVISISIFNSSDTNHHSNAESHSHEAKVSKISEAEKASGSTNHTNIGPSAHQTKDAVITETDIKTATDAEPSMPESQNMEPHTEPPKDKLSEESPHDDQVQGHSGPSKDLILLILALAKFAAVMWISLSTNRANKRKWNDLAVDFRYLSERMRPLNYLPLVSSFHPPDAAPAQYASRAVRQSAAEWLFGAISRSVSPKSFSSPTTYQRHNQSGEYEVSIQQFCPSGMLDKFNEHCVSNQAQYHKTNMHTMSNLHHFLNEGGKYLSYLVIGIVAVDIGILSSNVFIDILSDQLALYAKSAHALTPILLFFAALLPAVVASFNGLRFQSECQRLAERSAMLRTLMGGHAPKKNEGPKIKLTGGYWEELNDLKNLIAEAAKHPNTNIGAWSADTLQLIEKISDSLTREAAEWSVLYAKELPEL